MDSQTDSRPHILFLIDHLWAIAGTEGALLRTARHLPPSRYRCTIGAFAVRPDLPVLKASPWPVVEFPFNGTLSKQTVHTAMSVRRFIRSQKVDIVHTFLESANIWGGFFSILSGRPVLVSTRRDLGILRTLKHRLAYRLLNPFVDQVQAVSGAVREWTIRAEGLDPNKVVTIANGIELPPLSNVDDPAVLRRSLGLSQEARVILSVSNVREVKGIDVLIRAAKRVCSEYPTAVFLIAGAINEPDYYERLQRLTEEIGVTSNVRFLGECDNVQSLLRASEIFCLLSRSEGMSNSLLEAMASGLPCVATAVGGTSEVVSDGSDGYLVPSEESETAADRIMTLLRNRDLAARLGRAARQTAEAKFSAQRMVSDLAAMYDRLLEGRGLIRPCSRAECAPV